MGSLTTRDWLNEMESMMPHFFGRSVFPTYSAEHPYKMEEKDSYYHISLDVPGVEPKSIQMRAKGQVLSIKSSSSDKGERRSVSVSLTIPSDVDTSKIEANMENGVMDIIFPKTSMAQVKEIPVRSSTTFLDKVKKQFSLESQK